MFKSHNLRVLSMIIQLRPRRDVFTFNRKAGWWIIFHPLQRVGLGSDDQLDF